MASTVRALGWLLVLLAAAVLGEDLFTLTQTGRLELSSLGDLWHSLHPDSLRVVQATVEGHLSEALWDHLLAPLLPQQAVLVFGLPGVVLAALPALVERVSRAGESEVS